MDIRTKRLLKNCMAFKDPDKKKAYHAAWYLRNKEKKNEQSREWYKANRREHISRTREYSKNNPMYIRRHKWAKMGMCPDEAQTMYEAFKGSCHMCGSDKNNARTDWQVDHDHSTGRVRGVLCHRCNLQLGFMERDGDFSEIALEYLRATNGCENEEAA